MEYPEALKKVQAKKTRDPNFLVIHYNYDCKIVLPYDDGMNFVKSLEKAEMLRDSYNEQHRIEEIEREQIRFWVMSREEYERYKIAALLGIKPDEVKEMQRPQPVTQQ